MIRSRSSPKGIEELEQLEGHLSVRNALLGGHYYFGDSGLSLRTLLPVYAATKTYTPFSASFIKLSSHTGSDCSIL
jgi:hypothetical protein